MPPRLTPEQRKARAALRRELEWYRGFASIYAGFAKGMADQVKKLEAELATLEGKDG